MLSMMLIRLLSLMIGHALAGESPRGPSSASDSEAVVSGKTKSEESSDEGKKTLIPAIHRDLVIDLVDDVGIDVNIVLRRSKDGRVLQLVVRGWFPGVYDVIDAPGLGPLGIKCDDTSDTSTSKSSGDETLEDVEKQQRQEIIVVQRQFHLLDKAARFLIKDKPVDGHLSMQCRAAIKQAMREYNKNEQKIMGLQSSSRESSDARLYDSPTPRAQDGSPKVRTAGKVEPKANDDPGGSPGHEMKIGAESSAVEKGGAETKKSESVKDEKTEPNEAQESLLQEPVASGHAGEDSNLNGDICEQGNIGTGAAELVRREDEDGASSEEIAIAVAIGFLILTVCIYFGLVTRAIYQAAHCESEASETDIFSEGFVERQRRIFEIEEKNKKAKISMADFNQIEEDNRDNPLHYTKVIQRVHKKLTKAIALEDAENERRDKLKKRRRRRRRRR